MPTEKRKDVHIRLPLVLYDAFSSLARPRGLSVATYIQYHLVDLLPNVPQIRAALQELEVTEEPKSSQNPPNSPNSPAVSLSDDDFAMYLGWREAAGWTVKIINAETEEEKDRLALQSVNEYTAKTGRLAPMRWKETW